MAAPLLEEERNAFGAAAVAQVAQPSSHRPVDGRGPDSPPAISQSIPSRSRPSSGPSSGSADDESDRGRDLAQRVGAMDEAAILDRDAHPDVGRPRQSGRELGEPVLALRQHLEGVPVGLASITSKTRAMNSSGTSSWNRSDIELTKIDARPPPLERHAPAARARAAGRSPARTGGRARRASARRTSWRSSGRSPGETFEQPVTGFQVASVHSMALLSGI